MERCTSPARATWLAAAGALLALVSSAGAGAQDRLAVAEVGGLPGQTVRVPVHVRDIGGTALDEGDGDDLEIQAFAFRLDFPATWVTSVDFEQAGVTAGKTAFFSSVDPHPDHIIVLFSFNEMTNPLTFTLDRPLPGDTLGNVVFGTSGAAPLGSEVPITHYFNPGIGTYPATLSNETGTVDETVADGMLVLGNGKITFTPAIFADGFEGGTTCAWSARTAPPICG